MVAQMTSVTSKRNGYVGGITWPAPPNKIRYNKNKNKKKNRLKPFAVCCSYFLLCAILCN